MAAMYFKVEKVERFKGMRVKHSEMYIAGFTLRAALEKQAEQLDFYLTGKPYERLVREAIFFGTNVDGVDLDAEIPVAEINRRVPRGGDIECLVAKYKQ